jgi:membrane peptidoglycan carboxypeptidase
VTASRVEHPAGSGPSKTNGVRDFVAKFPRLADYPRQGKQGWRRWVPSWKLVLGAGFAGFCLLIIAFGVIYHLTKIPQPNQLALAQSSVVYYSDGKTPIGTFQEVNRTSVPLSQVPVAVQHEVVSAEDRSFYTNKGIDPRGIARAFYNNIRGGAEQGGSTITQQYVKNYFLDQNRSLSRKFKEFFISIKIDRSTDKNAILQDYLNTIYFGRGAYGIQAASHAYFGVDVSKLTPAQGAVLASVIRAPALYDPALNLDRAKARWNYVMSGMVQGKYLTQAQVDALTYPKVQARPKSSAQGKTTGYLLDVVRREVEAKLHLSDSDIDRGGLRIVTTFSVADQKAAVDAINAQMPKTGAKGVRVGLVSIKPGNGAVVAMYGGPDSVTEPFNAATQSTMQAGSTFKPFALITALGQGISLKSRFSGSSPKVVKGFSRPVVNFGGEQFGDIDLVQATENSVNTVYAQLNAKVGPDKTLQTAIAAGLPQTTAGLTDNAANVLGTASPHVIDMASAYATFAAQGVYAQPYTVARVTSTDGSINYKAKPVTRTVFDPDVMADATFAMSKVVQSGTGAGANFGRPAAGKTGTTTGNVSAWFDGFTPQLATSVGMYRNSKSGKVLSLNGLGGRSNVQGATFAVPIWRAYMEAAMKGLPVKDFPPEANVGQPINPAPTKTATPTTTATPTQSPTTTPTQTQTPTGPPTSPTGSPSAAPALAPASGQKRGTRASDGGPDPGGAG